VGALELLLAVVLGVLALGLWFALRGRDAAPRSAGGAAPVTPQQLAPLAQPYRGYLGEAVAIQREVRGHAERAPRALQYELGVLAWRVEQLVARALPRAQHGTELAAFLLRLAPDDPQRPATLRAAEQLEAELALFTARLKELRGKVYQVITDAEALAADTLISQELDDALLEVSALEAAFSEVRLEEAR
jgi:hypothetical protein